MTEASHRRQVLNCISIANCMQHFIISEGSYLRVLPISLSVLPRSGKDLLRTGTLLSPFFYNFKEVVWGFSKRVSLCFCLSQVHKLGFLLPEFPLITQNKYGRQKMGFLRDSFSHISQQNSQGADPLLTIPLVLNRT